MDPVDVDKFVDELKWCINQLELGLQRQSPDSKQAQDTLKILKILRSSKAPLIKKRQAMRNALGDYRKKMKDEQKKSLNAMKHSSFKPKENMKIYRKSKFLRRSHLKEVVFAKQDEDNRFLSINLNNLNLHQEAGSAAAGPLSSLNYMPSNPTQTSASCGEYITAENSSSCSSSLTEPFCTDMTEKQTSFKYNPSDNSFLFNFCDELSSESRANEMNSELSNKSVDGDSNLKLEGNSLWTSDKSKECGNENQDGSSDQRFHFTKSDNSFSFDFNMNE